MVAVEAIATTSFIECLRSVGGVQVCPHMLDETSFSLTKCAQVLLPLFTQMNNNVAKAVETKRPSVYGALLGFILSMVRSSSEIRSQTVQINGFLVLGYLLEQVRFVQIIE